MSTKREEPPFVSDEQIRNEKDIPLELNNGTTIVVMDMPMSPYQVRDIYEAEISRLRTEQEGKWISVDEAEPERGEIVEVWCCAYDIFGKPRLPGKHVLDVGLSTDGSWRVWGNGRSVPDVTHWRRRTKGPSIEPIPPAL